jgi:hypothetical protein
LPVFDDSADVVYHNVHKEINLIVEESGVLSRLGASPVKGLAAISIEGFKPFIQPEDMVVSK